MASVELRWRFGLTNELRDLLRCERRNSDCCPNRHGPERVHHGVGTQRCRALREPTLSSSAQLRVERHGIYRFEYRCRYEHVRALRILARASEQSAGLISFV